MNGRNEENLKELFDEFLGSEQAEQAVEDIRRGEQVLREHPAPAPSDALIADIKAEVREAVLRGKADAFGMRELFEKFLGSEEAQRAVEDIQEAEEILHEYPGPEPSAALIADIKAEIGERLLGRKRVSWRRIAYETAAVAAIFIILAVVSVKLFERPSREPGRVMYASIIPASIWESDDIATDDTSLAMLTAEVDQIEEEALALRLGGGGVNGERAVAELEMELMDIDSDFWKG